MVDKKIKRKNCASCIPRFWCMHIISGDDKPIVLSCQSCHLGQGYVEYDSAQSPPRLGNCGRVWGIPSGRYGPRNSPA